jgi:hypothetical protein
MILNYSDINQIIFQNNNYVEDVNGEPGNQHYKLLAWLSNQVNNSIIFDIGTHVGLSAFALGHNKSNTVYSFDLLDKLSTNEKEKLWTNNNVVFSTNNLMDDTVRALWKDKILSSSIIFLDIDPHDGTLEYDFYLWLKSINYKGILVLDDIWAFKGMRDNLWYKITSENKYDITGIGHWSGTGLIAFGGQKVEIYEKIPQRVPTYSSEPKSWTVVTAYFNLTKAPDASNAIKERDFTHYMNNANMTMALDQNLVVYCDAESEAYLRNLRPVHLLPKTKFHIIEFMDLEIVKMFYQKVVESRKRVRKADDPRNTSSYYLFCMTRYELLLRTIKENPFNSTHFAWCNICIERMGWKSGIIFPKIWAEFRDKFSTCYINYQPKNLVIDNPKEYYKYGGRCGMCSGFFTGNKYYMSAFCMEIIKAFGEMLSIDCGHADEQLFSIVYFKRPELFEFYLGDYPEMIINYGWVLDRPLEPVNNVIMSLYNSGENRSLLYTLTSKWLQSYNFGCFQIDNDTVNLIKSIKNESLKELTTIN